MIYNKIIPFEKDKEKRKEAMQRINIRQQVYHLLKTAKLEIVPYMSTGKNSIQLSFNHDNENVHVALDGRILFALTYLNKDKVLNVVKDFSELNSDREGFILVDSIHSAQKVLGTIMEELYLFFNRDASYDAFMKSVVSGWNNFK